jgi:hypothetical protein
MGVKSDWDQAVHGVLSGDAALGAVIDAVYTGVAPQNCAFPYVYIDRTDFTEYSDASHTGFEVFMRIITVSRSPGRKETVDIQDLIYDALHRQEDSIIVPGHSVLTIDRDSSDPEEPGDVDGAFQGVCEYRALVTKNAAD